MGRLVPLLAALLAGCGSAPSSIRGDYNAGLYPAGSPRAGNCTSPDGSAIVGTMTGPLVLWDDQGLLSGVWVLCAGTVSLPVSGQRNGDEFSFAASHLVVSEGLREADGSLLASASGDGLDHWDFRATLIPRAPGGKAGPKCDAAGCP